MPTVEFLDVLHFLEPIRDHLMNDSISEVMVNADEKVFVEENGLKREVFGCRIDKSDLLAAIKRISRSDDTEPDSPIINVRLGDGSSRVCIVMPPVSKQGPTMSIRKFRHAPYTAQELIDKGSLPAEVFAHLRQAVQANKNILISGGFGTGKTTILNVLALEIPHNERICLLEFPSEIKIPHKNQVALQASDSVDFSTIIKKGVTRLNPERLILGEVSGPEAFDLLRALNLGLRGSFATIHADTAEEALYTLASLASSAKPNLVSLFIREQVARAIHYVLSIVRRPDGTRAVAQLIKVNGYSEESRRFEFDELYRVKEEGKLLDGHTESRRSAARGVQ